MTACATQQLCELATLLSQRNAVDERIASLIRRPAERGHIGEFIARCVFNISTPDSARHPDHDGQFHSGVLRGKTVNIKFYGTDHGGWAIKDYCSVDFYLVMCGGKESTPSSRGKARPLAISAVYLVPEEALKTAGVEPGNNSVREALRTAYQIYPISGPQSLLRLTKEQHAMLQEFSK